MPPICHRLPLRKITNFVSTQPSFVQPKSFTPISQTKTENLSKFVFSLQLPDLSPPFQFQVEFVDGFSAQLLIWLKDQKIYIFSVLSYRRLQDSVTLERFRLIFTFMQAIEIFPYHLLLKSKLCSFIVS